MKIPGLLLLTTLLLAACGNNDKAPDISGIQYQVTIKRFDQDFFAMDTQQIDPSMNRLQSKYPQLLGIFLQQIVGITDPEGVKTYLRNYHEIYDSAQQVFSNLTSVKNDLEKAGRYILYYYPDYDLPKDLIPVLGPLESRDDFARLSNGELTPNFLGADFAGISLQFYLGASYSLYNTEYFVTNVAPLFRSRRFSKEYMVPDIVRLFVDDLYPDRSYTQSLIEQIIEKGKRWWLMEKFMPFAADSVITGYKQSQIEWCKVNEGMIWNFLMKNEKLDSKEPAAIQTYLGEAPFTIGMPQEYSPGNIGVWIGRQIVRKFAASSGLKPDDIMKMPAEKILEEAKYRPK